MAFKDIPGNTRIKRILKLALERGRVPNSLLFSGPEGIGKRRMALTVAKALNCLTMTTDSCDACPSCRAVDEGRFPDVLEIEAEGKEISIAQIRLLKQMAYLKPMTGRTRVFILNEAETLSGDAAHSLLKVLEEPPLFSHIILVTTSPFLLLPTIQSRCQALTFAAITKEEIEEILVEREYPAEQAKILSLLVDGNLSRALDLEWADVEAQKETAWAEFEGMLTGRRGSLFLERFGSLTKPMHEEFEESLELYASFCRDLLLIKLRGDPRFLLNPDNEARLRQAAAEASSRRLTGILAEIDNVLSELRGNLNKNLLVATFFSNMGELRHV